jgi:hypothetical protein
MSWDRWAEGTITHQPVYARPLTIRWWINAEAVGRSYGVGAEFDGPTRMVTCLCQHRNHRSHAGAWACVLDLLLQLRRLADAAREPA